MIKILGYNIRPEINELRYYLHIIIIAFIIQQIMAFFGYCNHVINIIFIIKLSIAIILADVTAHTLLKLD